MTNPRQLLVVSILAASAMVLSGPPAAADQTAPEGNDKAALAKNTIVARAAELNTAPPAAPHPLTSIKTDRSMLKGMVILTDGKRWTAIPATSVLSRPQQLKDHFADEPSGTFVQWSEFVRHNRSWVSNYPVTINNIKGTTPLNKDQQKGFAKARRVSIATYHNSPVSVLPPKLQESDDK